ncbi:MAG TPA: hypothetical protein VF759_08825 [Allosphingosinicella sp.]
MKYPKLGDRIGISRFGRPTIATIVGLSLEHDRDGRGTLLVTASSAA